ncbi:hypothetical protein MASR2M78_01690 [Treponema sp.]
MTSPKRVVALSLAILVSLASMLLAYLYRPFTNSKSAYFKITLDAKADEGAALKKLQDVGLKNIISESTEWIYLDAFGELEKVPLTQYAHRLESFDPRNDGYADTLRTLFLTENMRYLYLSMNDLSLSMQNSKLIHEKIDLALKGQNYSIESFGLALSSFWNGILFVLAALISIFLSGSPLLTLAIIPSLSSFSLFGPAGLVAAGLCIALVSSLLDPGRNLLRKGQKRSKDFRLLLELFGPSLIALSAYAFICLMGNIPAMLSILNLLSIIYISVLYLVLSEKHDVQRGHTRFVPLPIKRAYPDIILVSRSTLPFVAASLLVFSIQIFKMDVKRGFAAPFQNNKAEASGFFPVDVQGFLEASQKHLAFQKSFSLQSMNAKGNKGSYESYTLAKDGLVDSVTKKASYSGHSESTLIPPMERMLSTLNNPQSLPSSASCIGSIIAVAFALLFALPSIRVILKTRRRRRELPSYIEKRIAA